MRERGVAVRGVHRRHDVLGPGAHRVGASAELLPHEVQHVRRIGERVDGAAIGEVGAHGHDPVRLERGRQCRVGEARHREHAARAGALARHTARVEGAARHAGQRRPHLAARTEHHARRRRAMPAHPRPPRPAATAAPRAPLRRRSDRPSRAPSARRRVGPRRPRPPERPAPPFTSRAGGSAEAQLAREQPAAGVDAPAHFLPQCRHVVQREPVPSPPARAPCTALAPCGSGRCPWPSRGACRPRRWGGSGTPVLIASRNAPSLNGQHGAVARARPFREDHHRDALLEPVATLRERLHRAVAVAARELDVAGHLHHPAHARDLEHRVLAQPLHLPRKRGDEEHVGVRLVVGHHHVRAPRIGEGSARACRSARRD